MKNSLMIPAVFIVSCTVLFALFGFFVTLTQGSSLELLRVARFPVFIASALKTSLYLLPLSVCFAILGVYLFLMRHPCTPWLALPLVVLISVLAWLVFVPFSYFMNDRLSYDSGPDYTSMTLTAGVPSPMIIRPYPGDLRAFWLASGQDSVQSAVIASGQAAPDTSVLRVYTSLRYDPVQGRLLADDWPVLVDVSGPERLFRSRLNRPHFLSRLVDDVQAMLTRLRNSWDRGLSVYFLQAGAFAFALLGLWFCCTVTGWRMLNLVLSLAMLRVLFALYSVVGSEGFPDQVTALLPARLQGEVLLPVMLAGIGVLFCLARLFLLVVRRGQVVRAGVGE